MLREEMNFIKNVVSNEVVSQYLRYLMSAYRKKIKYSRNEYLGYHNEEENRIYVPKLSYGLLNETYVNQLYSSSRCFQVMILIHELIHMKQVNEHLLLHNQYSILQGLKESLDEVNWTNFKVAANIFWSNQCTLKEYILKRMEYASDSKEAYPVYFEIYILLNYYGLEPDNCAVYQEIEYLVNQFIIRTTGGIDCEFGQLRTES